MFFVQQRCYVAPRSPQRTIEEPLKEPISCCAEPQTPQKNRWRTAEVLRSTTCWPQEPLKNQWSASLSVYANLWTDGSRIFSLPNASHLSSFISTKTLGKWVSLQRSTGKAHSVPLKPISLCSSPAAVLAAPRRFRVKEAVRRAKQRVVFRCGTIQRASWSVTNRTAAGLINKKRGPWADCLMSCHDCKPNYPNGR